VNFDIGPMGSIPLRAADGEFSLRSMNLAVEEGRVRERRAQRHQGVGHRRPVDEVGEWPEGDNSALAPEESGQ
jgi:hypothetical protein